MAKPQPRRPGLAGPAEGWLTLLLHAALIAATAWTMERALGAPGRATLLAAALGGLATGFLLAKRQAPDMVAHVVAFVGGVLVALLLGAARLDPLVGGWRARVRFQWELLLEWYRRLLSDRPLDDPQLFAAVIALTLWLVAYTSGWVLYRRGWLTTALVVPGLIAVVNLGYVPAGPGPLIAFLAAACLLAARHHLFRREREWATARMPQPRRLPWRFVAAGANIALLVAILTWTLPWTSRELITSAAWQRLEAPWGAAVERWQDLVGDLVGQRASAPGSYAAFDDSFRLGGELDLSDEEVAVLRPAADATPRPTYLAGRRYNLYDGRGWSSDAADTFAAAGDGARYSPQMSFAAGLGVHLSDGVLGERSSVAGELTVLRPKGHLLLTADTFETADRPFNVELSWRQLDGERFDLSGAPPGVIARLPADLRGLAGRLLRTDFAGAAATASEPPLPADDAAAEELSAERAALERRFLTTSWTVGADGRVAELVVSGQLPVYDDVEAVASDQPIAEGSVYAVSGLRSAATPDDLRGAGEDYPAWVRDRYLPLPETITPRTRDLAAELARGEATPFDVARATEGFVREAIRYEEQIASPPSDQDVVDFVLFDSREGYCEYYASAMAVLLRLNDIPARVVGGYFAVPLNADVGGFLYRERNAHLWVEVYFPGYGWIPFEPTAGRSRLAYGTTDAPLPPEASPTVAAATPPAVAATPPPSTASTRDQPGAEAGRPSVLGRWLLAGGALLALLIAAVAAAWSWGLRGLSPAGGLYARALRLGRWLGVRPTASTTPAEYAERLGRAVPAARQPARIVSDVYSREAYAGRAVEPPLANQAARAWRDLRRTVAGAALRRRLGGRRGKESRR